jgi:hypothetical protein
MPPGSLSSDASPPVARSNSSTALEYANIQILANETILPRNISLSGVAPGNCTVQLLGMGVGICDYCGFKWPKLCGNENISELLHGLISEIE